MYKRLKIIIKYDFLLAMKITKRDLVTKSVISKISRAVFPGIKREMGREREKERERFKK